MKISGIKDHSNNNFLYFAMHIERVKLISWFTFSNCVPHQNASDSTEPISEFTFVDVHGYVDHIIPITGMTWNFIVYYILLGNIDRISRLYFLIKTRMKNINKPVYEYQSSFRGIHTMLQLQILPHQLP